MNLLKLFGIDLSVPWLIAQRESKTTPFPPLPQRSVNEHLSAYGRQELQVLSVGVAMSCERAKHGGQG